MTIYTGLNAIDNFEQRHGFEDTLKRARDFMISYLELMKTALPDPARRGLEAAKKYSEGTLISEDLEATRRELWKYLREHHASADYKTPSNAIVHAAFGLLSDHKDLKPGETISERVSSFLDCTNQFEDHSDSVQPLLKTFYFE